MAGSKPGERRGGRQKGTPNKITRDVKAAAQAYTQDALDALVHIMKAGESEAARVAAANSILDRGYGKPKQETTLTGPNDGPIMLVTGVPRADD